ncbi:MAG: hypothetical protein BIFFINMI_03679 [Phycisphaerae bacterium]|nr:hypothetical protein [Phycisphaerae bacterium]
MTQPTPSPPPPPPQDEPPKSWLFEARSLGASLRIYLPMVVLVRFLGLVRIVVLGVLMTSPEYGLLRLAMLMVGLCWMLTTLGLVAGLDRYVPMYEAAGQLRPFARRAVGLCALAGGVLIGAFLAGAPWLAQIALSGSDADALGAGGGYLLGLMLLVVLSMALSAAYFVVQGLLRGLRMYRAISIMEMLHGAGFLALAVALLLTAPGGTVGQASSGALRVMWAYAGSLALAVVPAGAGLWLHLRRWQSQRTPLAERWGETAGKLLRYSGFLLVTVLLTQGLLMFGPWLLNKRYGAGPSGLFSYPRDLMQFLPLLGGAVWATAQNAANRHWERGAREVALRQLGLIFRVSGWLFWLSSAAVVLGRGPLVRLLRADYASAGPLLAWFLVSYLLALHVALPHASAVLLENTRVRMWSAVLGLAVHVGAALWLLRGVTAEEGAYLAALRMAQAGALAMAATLVSLWVMVRAIGGGIRWSRGQDLVVAASPLVLLLPWAWPAGGDWLLGGATVAACALLLCSSWLWTADDRRTLGAYVRENVGLLLGRRGNAAGPSGRDDHS